MKRSAIALCTLGVVGAGVFWVLTAPNGISAQSAETLNTHTVDLSNGENLFWAGGCTSCHAAPKAEGDAKLVLSGGHVLKSDFGDFPVPNISSDEEHGIGAWSLEAFANAMMKGVSPDGRHYYPAFPYASYARMTMGDVADILAFIKTLPASAEPSVQANLSFPFNVRRGIGLWKILYLSDQPVISDAALGADAQLIRGRYLVEGAGHCGECHTPRTLAGGLNLDQWLKGAPNPEGKGRIPGITNSADDLADWVPGDIAYALETGFTPEFDSLGSSMTDVVTNYANVDPADREAIAAYLKSLN